MKNLIEIAEQVLLESNLSRLLSHTQNRGVGVISSNRGEYPAQENQERHEQLKSDVRAAGFGYVPVQGKYVENYGTEHENPVSEKALIVIGKEGDDEGHLKTFLKHHGEKYGQDSVLHKPHDSENAVLIGTNQSDFPGYGNEHSVGQFRPNRVREFHSMLKNGRTFTFESVEPQKTFLNRA
jgi:hypothetical protein